MWSCGHVTCRGGHVMWGCHHRATPAGEALWSSSMASPGSGGVQYRRRDGPMRGKGRFNKESRDRGGGGVQAGKRRAEPWRTQRNVRRTWKSSQQVLAGSAKEGQGFALWRKQKVQLDYKKLQRKQRKTTAAKDLYADKYPEHLKHLYLAEEERLNNVRRKQKPEEEQPTQTTEEAEKEAVVVEKEAVVVPKKKFKNKTSLQKAKEEYKQVQQERARKRKEAEENRRKREEAKEVYMKKKMEAYKVLNTKTKKGQPNFNVQMEYLLKKIQSQT